MELAQYFRLIFLHFCLSFDYFDGVFHFEMSETSNHHYQLCLCQYPPRPAHQCLQ